MGSFHAFNSIYDLHGGVKKETIEFYGNIIAFEQITPHKNSLSIVLPALAEQRFYELKRPIYNLYPGIDEVLLETNINILPSELYFPYDAFAYEVIECN